MVTYNQFTDSAEWKKLGLLDFADFSDFVDYKNQGEDGFSGYGSWYYALDNCYYAPEGGTVIYYGRYANDYSPGASMYTFADVFDANEHEGYLAAVATWEAMPEFDSTLSDDEEMDEEMEATVKSQYGSVTFTDSDVVNPDEWAYEHNHLYLLHHAGKVIGVVFARSEQEAMDELADSGKLDSYRMPIRQLDDDEGDGDVSYLGNGCEPFDISELDYNSLIELKRPPFSLVALYNADNSKGGES